LKSKISIIVFSVLFSIVVWGSVTLSNEFFSTSSFDVNIVNQPNGYASGKTNPQNVFVKLKAKGWQLLSLNLGSKLNFNVSADNDSGKITVDPYNEIDENNWISSGINILEINPREISFVVEKIKYKKLKIVPNAELSFSDGFGLATPINIYPDSVLVAGPASILDTLKSIKNIRVKLTSADSKASIITELETLPGFTVDRNKVQLTFDVQRIVEKSFEGIKVVINDIPKDRDIVLIPNIIECNLRGGINILGKITSDQLYASISYSEIVYDTLGSIQPKVIIPNNTKQVYIKPERLNYIIKKFE
jgi:YbbR domain-containing protein